MSDSSAVPEFKKFSPTMRIDVSVGDWRSELPPQLSVEERERALYGKVWNEYHEEGDYGFGLWLWFECDRLTNAFNGSVRDVTRVLGEGRYFGFSHRKAVAERVPIEKVWRPRKGDMSTPRTDATVLAGYQMLCVHAIRAKGGDPKAKAELAIALLEHDERRRADAFFRHFETFQRLLDRADAPGPSAAASAPPSSPPEDPVARPPPAVPSKAARSHRKP